MKHFLSLLAVLILLAGNSCKKNPLDPGPDPNDSTVVTMQHIVPSGKQLINEDGEIFRIWGLNWGPPEGELLETIWTTEQGWRDLVKDFEDAHNMGANLIRLPIQYNFFMDSPTEANALNLERLRVLVKVAEQYDLYVLICGLNAFKKDLQPAWYSQMNEQERWATQAIFWKNVAATVGNIPAVLGYDLMNEPTIANRTEEGWLPGGSMGGYHFAQNITLDLAGRTEEAVLKSWINTMTNAIRQEDDKHLITVGYLPYAKFSRFSKDVLTAMSTHIYPERDNIAASNRLVQDFQTDLPLIISETFPLHCSPEELEAFIKSQNSNVNGWIWIGGGESIEDLTPPESIPEAIFLDALKKFKEMAPTQK